MRPTGGRERQWRRDEQKSSIAPVHPYQAKPSRQEPNLPTPVVGRLCCAANKHWASRFTKTAKWSREGRQVPRDASHVNHGLGHPRLAAGKKSQGFSKLPKLLGPAAIGCWSDRRNSTRHCSLFLSLELSLPPRLPPPPFATMDQGEGEKVARPISRLADPLYRTDWRVSCVEGPPGRIDRP
jgi:hypothetical protein